MLANFNNCLSGSISGLRKACSRTKSWASPSNNCSFRSLLRRLRSFFLFRTFQDTHLVPVVLGPSSEPVKILVTLLLQHTLPGVEIFLVGPRESRSDIMETAKVEWPCLHRIQAYRQNLPWWFHLIFRVRLRHYLHLPGRTAKRCNRSGTNFQIAISSQLSGRSSKSLVLPSKGIAHQWLRKPQ